MFKSLVKQKILFYVNRIQRVLNTDNGTFQERRTFMDLNLDTKDQEILAWALTSAISDLGHEIAHTEKYELRQELKERKSWGLLTLLFQT